MNVFRFTLAAIFLCSAMTMAAQSLPPGTALPVEMGSSLNAKNAKPGQKIETKIIEPVTQE